MVVRFGDCEIDLDRVEIRRAGEAVPVQPQVFSVIEYLVRNRDRVVTRDELLDNVWGDRFVSDSTVTSRIKFARRALGDTGAEQGIIRTVQGRGYRFVADASDTDVAPHTEAPARIADGPVLAEPGAADRVITGATATAAWPLVGRYEDIERIVDLATTPGVAGALVTGPAGIGKSALVEATRSELVRRGHVTHRIAAMSSTTGVPLAALAPILPEAMLDEIDLVGDLAAGVLFRSARDAIRSSVSDAGPIVVTVDDADRLDPLSIALLSSSMIDGALFVIATQRSAPATSVVFDELVRDRLVRRFPLEPLGESELDVLLYRVLEGPIDAASMRRLGDYSRGNPGLLRSLVEESQGSGSLIREEGVWRLAGPPTGRHGTWPEPTLAPSTVNAAEVLALIGTLPVDTASTVMGDDEIDELDRLGYLSLVERGGQELVSFSDPLLVDTIVSSITPVRLRRHKEALVTSLLGTQPVPHVAAVVATWADELGAGQEPVEALLAAQRALNRGDDDAAETLVDLVERSGEEFRPYIDAIRAEISLRRSQFERAEALLHGIATEELDETTRSFVYRRMVTVRCYARSEYAESAEWLEERAASAPPAIAASLSCNRVHMLAMIGRVDDAIELSESLIGTVTELSEVERALSTARAEYLGGRLQRALDVLDRHDAESAHVLIPGTAVEDPLEASRATRLSCWLALGEIRTAQALIRSEAIARRRATRSWVTLAAAEVELEAGRSRLAREMVRRTMDTNRRQGLRMGRIAAEAMFARTSAMLGESDESNEMLDDLLAELPTVGPSNSWYVSEAAARTAQLLGRGDELLDTLVAHAAEARDRGATLSCASLLTTAATISSDQDFATSTVAELETLAGRIGGMLWPIRVAHVRAVGAGAELGSVGRSYRELGYHALAATCGVQEASPLS